jgi:hypothetical protein
VESAVRRILYIVLVLAFVKVNVLRPADADAIEDVLAATCRIANSESSGTCFLVSVPAAADGQPARVVLVTAAHFFEGTSDPICRLVLREQTSDLAYARREIETPIRDGDAPRWKRHPELDIAVLPIEPPAGSAVRPLQIEHLADEARVQTREVHVGQDVFVPGFPAQLEANEAGWPVLRKGAIASFPLAPLASAKTILVDAKTFGGDSGAPVAAVVGDSPLVVGLVLGMHRQTDKSVLPFEERTMHTPLGLAIVVQAGFIRETIGLLSH